MKTAAIIKLVCFSLLALLIIAVGLGAVWGYSFDFATYPNASRYTVVEKSAKVPNENLRNLTIHWASGAVRVAVLGQKMEEDCRGMADSLGLSTADTHITLAEEASSELKDDAKMRYFAEGDTLTVRAQGSRMLFSFWGERKTLYVFLPAHASYHALRINTASADIRVDGQGLTAQSVRLNTASGQHLVRQLKADHFNYITASGRLTLENVQVTDKLSFNSASGSLTAADTTVGKLSCDTASGHVTFQGGLHEADIDTASGKSVFTLNHAPNAFKGNSASGSFALILPADSTDFAIDLDTASGDLTSNFNGTFSRRHLVVGSGAKNYSFDTASGDVTVKWEE